MLRAKSFSVFQSMSHSLSPDAAVFIPRQIPVDGPLQVQQIPSYMTNCYPFVQLDAERYGYGIIYISIMITVNQNFICVRKFFTRFARAWSWHKYISVFKCIWCIIFLIIYIFIAKLISKPIFLWLIGKKSCCDLSWFTIFIVPY